MKERTKAMRTAAARFWRSKGRLSFKEDNVKKALYLEGRRKLRFSEINKKVAEEFDEPKDLAQQR